MLRADSEIRPTLSSQLDHVPWLHTVPKSVIPTGVSYRWSIIRVIWFRELRDQLRDRRTIFMIAVLPILLYPLLGMGMMQLAVGFLRKPNVIGVLGRENLPGPAPGSSGGHGPSLAHRP